MSPGPIQLDQATALTLMLGPNGSVGIQASGFGEIKTQKSFLSDHLRGPTCQVLTAPEQADEGSRSDRREEA